MTAASRILAQVQTNPEILTANSSYVTALVAQSMEILRKSCRLKVFPDLLQGYSKSAVTPSTDISGIASNSLYLAVNDGDLHEIEPTLSSCDTGAHTATELQAKIRAEDWDWWDEVTVAYDATSGAEYYTFTSAWYGERSKIHLAFNGEDYKHVAQNLKLTPLYGGTEYPGSAICDELEEAAAMLTEWLYNKLGLEGAKQATVPGDVGFTEHDLMSHPFLGPVIRSKRRLF